MEERSLSRQVVIVWRLRGTLLAVAAAFLCGALAVFSRTLALLCASFGGAAYLLFMVWYCKARFESTTYALLPGVLLLRCGVFFQKEIRLEFARTQFCELMRSPAERALGLAASRCTRRGRGCGSTGWRKTRRWPSGGGFWRARRMKYSGVHPYTAAGILSRFAFLLIIPLFQGIFAQPQSLGQILRTWGLNLLVTALICLWAGASVRAQGYHAGEDRLFLKKGIILKRWLEIPYRNIHSITVERSLLPALFGAARRIWIRRPAEEKGPIAP